MGDCPDSTAAGEMEAGRVRRGDGGTVSILVTDLVGSTALFSRVGDEAGERLLKEHLGDIRRWVKQHGGREIKTTGDGIQAAFPSASAAGSAAVDIHRSLHRANEGRDEPLQVRIALHSGEVSSDRFDHYGIAVAVAARLCAKAEPGEILCSDTFRGLAGGRAKFGAPRRLRLKGIEGTVSAYPLGWEPGEPSVEVTGSRRGLILAGAVAAATLMAAGTWVMTRGDDPQAGTKAEVPPFTRVLDITSGTEPDGNSSQPSVSFDGGLVAFTSEATNLLLDDDNSAQDVFAFNGNRVEMVSVSTTGAIGDGPSFDPSVSKNGRYIAFTSAASNLAVKPDANGVTDVFVKDRNADRTNRVSLSASDLGDPDGASYEPSTSASGRYVAFTSKATNLVLGDTNNYSDIFVYDRDTDTTERISVSGEGLEGGGPSFGPAISQDGHLIAFVSQAPDLVEGDDNGVADVFLRDRTAGTTVLLSRSENGELGDGRSGFPSIAGSIVVFPSDSMNLVPDDTNGATDVFAVELGGAGAIRRVSLTTSGGERSGASTAPSVSADGRFIVFSSEASLVEGDPEGTTFDDRDVYVRDLESGITTLISEGAKAGYEADISGDGAWVAFISAASDLVTGDNNGRIDVFLRAIR